MSHVPSTVLHYFPGRGMANVVRHTMALAGMEWTEVRWQSEGGCGGRKESKTTNGHGAIYWGTERRGGGKLKSKDKRARRTWRAREKGEKGKNGSEERRKKKKNKWGCLSFLFLSPPRFATYDVRAFQPRAQPCVSRTHLAQFPSYRMEDSFGAWLRTSR